MPTLTLGILIISTSVCCLYVVWDRRQCAALFRKRTSHQQEDTWPPSSIVDAIQAMHRAEGREMWSYPQVHSLAEQQSDHAPS